MDFFSGYNNHQYVIDRINQKKEELQLKANKTSLKVIVFLMILNIISVFIMIGFSVNIAFYLINLAVIVLTILITFISKATWVKNTLINKTVNSEIIHLFNEETEYELSYLAKPKITSEFNKEMGLFTRGAGVSTEFQIKGFIEQDEIKIYKNLLTTSDGKTTYTHFNGLYIIYNNKFTNKIYQLRSKGRPSLKGVKFQRLEDEDVRVFIPKDDPNEYLDSNIINIFKSLNQKIDNKALYIGSNKEEIHIAIEPKMKFTCKNEIDLVSFEEYFNSFTHILRVVLELQQEI